MRAPLSLLGVSKNFGGAQALRDVTFTVEPGRIHALVGENGAGKSTAIKILSGLEQPSSGMVTVGGETVVLGGRSAAIRHGIGLVPQQLSLIGEMTLAENFILTQPSALARRRDASRLLRSTAENAGLAITIDRPVSELGLAERQLGELTIALAQGASILLLDEPTSAIGPYESGGLFEHVRSLADGGVGVVLITHRIDEVRQVADDVTVLSHGVVTLSGPVADFTDAELVQAMVGELPAVEQRPAFCGGRDRLVISGLTARGTGSAAIIDVDLTVRAGEIVGVLGVAGNGQNVLADAAATIIRPLRGTVTVDGVDVTGRADVAASAGVAYVPEVRGDFVVPDAPVTASAIVRRLRDPEFSRRGVLQWRAITEFTRGLQERHDVRPRNPHALAGSLSGGNQQKLLVGRELDGTPAVAILHGPTQGLDLSAAGAIRREITAAAANGTAVLLLSADVDEVRELADRILVVSHGRIVDEFETADFDSHRVGRAMAGLTEEASA